MLYIQCSVLYCAICRNDVKSGKDEIWFDDVDADDIEKATGVKQKKLSKSDNVHTHAHMSNNEVQQNEAKQQEPRYPIQMTE